MDPASRLVELSGLRNADLKRETAKYVRKNGIRRPVKILVGLLAHPCTQEQIENINTEFDRKYNSLEDDDMDSASGKPLKAIVLDTMAQNTAVIVGQGVDIAFKDNLMYNSQTGHIVVRRDASGNPDTRFAKCAKSEIPIESPSNESDPYKGSLQGKARTRKHKKRSKKTKKRSKTRKH